MKRRVSQKLLLLIATMQSISLHADCCPSTTTEFLVAPFVQWRSQSRNVPRKLVGTTSHHVYLHDMESFYGTFNVTPQYDQTFNGNKIAEVFFGSSLINAPATDDCNNDCHKALVVSGSLVPNRAPFEWMAENFYLPRDFKSVITFNPQLQDFLVDFYLYVGLDEWVKGMYFRIYGPVVNNRTTLNPCEIIEQPGTIGYAPGFFSANEVPTDILLPSALAFFSGRTTVIVPDITVDPLLKSKISCDKQSVTGFADLRGEFGWNYLHEDYHVGFNIQAAAPTGKRPNGEYLFEPYVGNGKHWELGLGLSAHWTMWRSQDDEQHLDFVFEADVTHLFNASQQRSFDLIGKPDSRYMLAEKMNLKPTQNLFGNLNGNATQATSQFNSEYSPVANFSTRHVNVSVGVQGDIVAMLNYTHHGFSLDLGYNYWGMSREDIDLTDCDNAPVFPENTWALKGDAQTFGFAKIGNPTLGVVTNVPLSGTEMGGTSTSGLGATIHQGTNIPAATDAMPAITNLAVDNAQLAQTGSGGLGSAIIRAGNADDTSPQIQTSIQPIFISVTDLNIEGAQTSGSSNKLFAHFSYTWIDREDWIPYLGIGFDAEFGNVGGRDNNNNGSCNNGISAALSEWAVFVKGGVSFD